MMIQCLFGSASILLGSMAQAADVKVGGSLSGGLTASSPQGGLTARGNVQFYQNFQNDIASFLKRNDNVVRTVNPGRKTEAIQSVLRFGASLGIDVTNLQMPEKGNLSRFKKDSQDGSLLAFLSADLADATGLEGGGDRELLVARQTMAKSTPASSMSKTQLSELAESVRTSYGLPPAAQDESVLTLNPMVVRMVAEEGSGALRQSLPLLRKFGDRRVINASFKVEVNPSTKKVSGMVLSNWWSVDSPKEATLKTAAEIKTAVQNAVKRLGSKARFSVTSCRPSFYQNSQAVFPSVTCYGKEILRSASKKSPFRFDITVSLAPGFATTEELDDGLVAPAEDPKESMISKKKDSNPSKTELLVKKIAPARQLASSGDEGTGEFYALYSNDLDLFYKGMNKFYGAFDTWSVKDLRRVYSSYLHGTSSSVSVDWADLAFVDSHGGLNFMFTDSSSGVSLNDWSAVGLDIPYLGNGDIEHLLFGGCLAASAVYCGGKSAVSRYTYSSSAHSIFYGLHHFASSHGTRISNNAEEKSFTGRVASYLDSGNAVVDAWIDAYNDGDDFLDDFDGGCDRVSDDTTCTSTDYQCSRWRRYPSVFYQNGKRNEGMDNRGTYTTDIMPSNSSYNIDLIYAYVESESTIPITTTGRSLP